MIKVVCGIIYKEDKVFIARKKKGKALAGYWEFPGGKIETDESPETALARELEEELGMAVSVGEFLGENIHQYPTQTIKLLAYNCIFIEATLNLTDHDQIKWVPPKELGKYQIAPADVPFISLAIEKSKWDLSEMIKNRN